MKINQMPHVGDEVELVLVTPNYYYHSEDRYTYRKVLGKVVPSAKWVPQDAFTLLRGDGGVSVIAMGLVESIKYINGPSHLDRPETSLDSDEDFLVFSTVSSRDTNVTYITQRLNGVWYCNCPGFEHRKNCKHIKAHRED